MGNCAWMFSTIVAGAKLASVSRISVSLLPIERESICDCKRAAGIKCVPVFSLAIKRVARSCAVAFRCTKTMGEHDESPACTVVVKLLYIPFFNLWEVNWEPALRRMSRYLGHNAEHANTTQVPLRSWSTSKSLSLVNHGMRSSSVRGTPLLIFSGSSNKALLSSCRKRVLLLCDQTSNLRQYKHCKMIYSSSKPRDLHHNNISMGLQRKLHKNMSKITIVSIAEEESVIMSASTQET